MGTGSPASRLLQAVGGKLGNLADMAAWDGVLDDISGDTLGNSSRKNTVRPASVSGQRGNAEELFFKGDFIGAAEAFTDAISLLPVSDNRGRAELLVKRATAFLRAGKYALANWDVELVLKDKTENESRTARALFIRSMIRRQKADFEGCEADLTAALSVPIWGEDSRKKLEAMLNTLKPEIQRYKFHIWMLKTTSAIMSWVIWYLLPLFMFTTAWLLFCVHTFTALFPSGELAADAWRVQVTATVGVIVAAGAWSWWLTDDHLRSKEPGSKHTSVRDRIAGFWISVRVFGFFPALRMLFSVIFPASQEGAHQTDMEQLKQDINDIQRRADPSKATSSTHAAHRSNMPSSKDGKQGPGFNAKENDAASSRTSHFMDNRTCQPAVQSQQASSRANAAVVSHTNIPHKDDKAQGKLSPSSPGSVSSSASPLAHASCSTEHQSSAKHKDCHLSSSESTSKTGNSHPVPERATRNDTKDSIKPR